MSKHKQQIITFDLDCSKCLGMFLINLPMHRPNKNGVARWVGVKCPSRTCDATYTIELEKANNHLNGY